MALKEIITLVILGYSIIFASDKNQVESLVLENKNQTFISAPTSSLDSLLTNDLHKELFNNPFLHDSVLTYFSLSEDFMTKLLTDSQHGGLSPAVSLAKVFSQDSASAKYFCWKPTGSNSEEVRVFSTVDVEASVEKVLMTKNDDVTTIVYYGTGSVTFGLSYHGYGLGVLQYSENQDSLAFRIDTYVEPDNWHDFASQIILYPLKPIIGGITAEVIEDLLPDLMKINEGLSSPNVQSELKEVYANGDIGLVQYYFLEKLISDYLTDKSNPDSTSSSSTVNPNLLK